jgi:hypothetical protein
VAGAILQLQLTNATGGSLAAGSSLSIAFDTVRFTAVGTANELPGYWVFISQDNGTTWTLITPTPTITTVPNTVGITATTLSYTLPSTWNSGATAYLRFVDDNAAQTSPDQIIGLNNVVITASGVDPNGRCCFTDGSCGLTTTGTCGAGGTFVSGQTCSPNTCPQPIPGVCCLTDGSCTIATPSLPAPTCAAGTAVANGTCSPNTCPQPPQGSCCAIDGSCTTTTQANCLVGSTWTNAGTCTPNTCPVLVVGLTASGYTQNFDTLGSSGTTLPSGWACKFLSGSHDVFSYAGSLATITTTVSPWSTPTGLNVGQGSSALSTSNTLIAVTDPTTQGSGSQCYNLGLSSSSTDRCLGSSPTGIAGIELQLSLRNDTGSSLASLTIGYDIRRFRTTANNNTGYSGPNVGLEEFPGYSLFVSTDDGATWSNAAAFNPTLAGPTGVIVPSSVGVTMVLPDLVTLPSPVGPGGTILLRWFDDNAQSPSPDQLIGLDNVIVSPANFAELGACCAGSGSCSYALSDDTCIGGIFRGVGTSCQPNPCPQPPSGSCCATDGSCTVVTQAACSALWTLDGVCVPNTCPGPLAACCAADGSCTLTAQNQCAGFAVAGTCTPASLCRQPGDTRAIAFGDYGIDGGNQPAVAARLKTFNPQFLVTTGDNTYFTTNAISNYDNTQAKYYGEFMKVINPSSTYFGTSPAVNAFFPVMGNHDMDIGGGASTSIPYFTGYFDLAGQHYYTFTKGPIQFFMLSSDPREPDSNAFGGTQYNWFINAYNASTAKFKIVVFHHPAQTSVSGHSPDTTMRGWNFQNLPGLTAVLSGHNHNMERLEFGGIPWFVTGAGGNSLYTISSVDPSSVFRNDTQWGFLLIDANAGGITFRFVNTSGQILDTRSVVLPGACCLTAGGCSSVANAAACTGTFQGAGVACGAGTCTPVTGACCNGISCSATTAAACVGSSSHFAGSGIACNAPGNNTTPCCRADFNGGGLAVQDIFDYLNAWFAGSASADFNGGGLAVQDIFDYLNAWFAGC